MGAMVEIGDDYFIAHQGSCPLQAIDWDCTDIPDAAMTLAVLALFANGTTHLRGIASWRVKETDRIAAMANELRKFGAHIETSESSIAITPGDQLPDQVRIKTYDDHRMAMCFSLAALGGVPVRIMDPRCVAKTFPEYFDVLASISVQ
jgi:3-phosphoshikimate 1-carboxyvinyltransferase